MIEIKLDIDLKDLHKDLEKAKKELVTEIIKEVENDVRKSQFVSDSLDKGT